MTTHPILTWSADQFVVGASGLAQSFGISPMVAGLTISASPPELAATVAAVRKGEHDMGVGARATTGRICRLPTMVFS